MFVSALLFSLGSNLDNLVIGSAYGLKKIKVDIWANLIIAFITSAGTLGSMLAGHWVALFLSPNLANLIGALTLMGIGLYFVVQSLRQLYQDHKAKALALKDLEQMEAYAVKSDINSNGKIDKREACLVAFGLAINNLGMGVSASITHVNIALTTVLTFAVSLATIWIGQVLARRTLGALLGKFAPVLSGILLIVLGAIEL